jgi:hypothetical protein
VLYSDEVNRPNAVQDRRFRFYFSPTEQAAEILARSVWFIVPVALLLRLAVITVGHTYWITPRRGSNLGQLFHSYLSASAGNMRDADHDG